LRRARKNRQYATNVTTGMVYGQSCPELVVLLPYRV
jgi:hypothetical protein